MGVKVALAISGKWHQKTGHGKRYAYHWSFSPMVELRSSMGIGGGSRLSPPDRSSTRSDQVAIVVRAAAARDRC